MAISDSVSFIFLEISRIVQEKCLLPDRCMGLNLRVGKMVSRKHFADHFALSLPSRNVLHQTNTSTQFWRERDSKIIKSIPAKRSEPVLPRNAVFPILFFPSLCLAFVTMNQDVVVQNLKSSDAISRAHRSPSSRLQDVPERISTSNAVLPLSTSLWPSWSNALGWIGCFDRSPVYRRCIFVAVMCQVTEELETAVFPSPPAQCKMTMR